MNKLKILKYLFLCAACLTISSCGTLEIASEDKYKQILDTYLNKPIDNVVKDRGQADNMSQSPNGNRLFVYSSLKTSTSPVTCNTDINGNKNCVGGDTNHNWCKTFFEVNFENIVTDYSFKGNNCRWCLSDNLLLCI